ncbi:Ivy family c-type lysozyme inhibitor [Rhodoblastus sp. 17X3]|uniref:Ivy family c-type lysozyme inhibitor n=1 Tax=Rhodoblastus sp. 17X3 TaxID=3047026 RepID=UPI0024B7866F|nr:Ivy family c-type lysozyme inhibitor [Rhodoblastus sp. 17X3]MDI9847939.1 Ivy family c-type lysozyme inhibitor [Rhodoblastus sp. 17X3]
MRTAGYWRNACLALLLAAISFGSARAQDYPHDLAKTTPAAFAAWRGVTPLEYRNKAWIGQLNGVSTPMERVTMRRRPFCYGSVCMPHDCGGNFVAFLIAVDGSEAAGLLASQSLGVGDRWFGAPDAEARALLRKKIGN